VFNYSTTTTKKIQKINSFKSYFLWKSQVGQKVVLRSLDHFYLNYFLKAIIIKSQTNNYAFLKLIETIYKENYPWPLARVLYTKEYSYVKNKLQMNGLWSLENGEILRCFDEFNDAINRKLEGSLYLIDNKCSI
jgi:hypothetical protein